MCSHVLHEGWWEQNRSNVAILELCVSLTWLYLLATHLFFRGAKSWNKVFNYIKWLGAAIYLNKRGIKICGCLYATERNVPGTVFWPEDSRHAMVHLCVAKICPLSEQGGLIYASVHPCIHPSTIGKVALANSKLHLNMVRERTSRPGLKLFQEMCLWPNPGWLQSRA